MRLVRQAPHGTDWRELRCPWCAESQAPNRDLDLFAAGHTDTIEWLYRIRWNVVDRVRRMHHF